MNCKRPKITTLRETADGDDDEENITDNNFYRSFGKNRNKKAITNTNISMMLTPSS